MPEGIVGPSQARHLLQFDHRLFGHPALLPGGAAAPGSRLALLRVFRLARLLKLTRGSDATATLFQVIKREWPVMSAAAFIMILLIVMTASLGYLFEHAAQPEKFENIPTAIYWAVITLASVGYGDISPITPIGRAMTVVMALLGIGIFAIPAGLLASAF
ncbi:MAG: two pore domain potassium channel family protein, partial [Betaproteobacteria bacterium]|nr:two pore domain potassium channel family protein [Betaproteobacteria bacterium]